MTDLRNIYKELNTNITGEFLSENPNCIFVFGDNLKRYGRGGAAKLRDYPNTYGFITKKAPTHTETDYFTVSEYEKVYKLEIILLKNVIKSQSDKVFLISPVGSGLANKFGIWESVIKPNIKNDLKEFENIIWLF